MPILTGGSAPTPMHARSVSNGVAVATSGSNTCGGLTNPCKIKARVGLQK